MTHSVRLRMAAKDDARAIKRLIRTARLNPFGLKWRRFVVAVDDDGRFIGCGQVKTHRDGSRELASIAVDHAWRRRGAASLIIRHWQQAVGPPLWLMCEQRLIPFYKPFGFCDVTASRALPPYFRRIARLAALFERVTGRSTRLAIMVWR